MWLETRIVLPIVLEFLQQLAHLDPRARVEAARRLVQQQQFRIVHQHPRQAQALFHPARERIHLRVALVREVGQRKHVGH